jgi:hypothetical protein
MKIRFIRPWNTYCKGDVIDPPGLLRDHLLRSGFAERVEPEPAQDKKEEPVRPEVDSPVEYRTTSVVASKTRRRYRRL